MQTQTVSLHIERHDQAHGFDDAVPADWSIARLTATAVPKLRLAVRDIATQRALKYSALHEGNELARDTTVGTAVRPGSRIVIAPEFENARE